MKQQEKGEKWNVIHGKLLQKYNSDIPISMFLISLSTEKFYSKQYCSFIVVYGQAFWIHIIRKEPYNEVMVKDFISDYWLWSSLSATDLWLCAWEDLKDTERRNEKKRKDKY